MKKLICVMLTLSVLLTLAACGGSGEQSTNPPAETQGNETTAPGADVPETTVPVETQGKEEGFVFEYDGITITMHAPAAPILEALGEPKKYTESASCAFEGLDKSYYYGSFYLDTYPKGEEDFVYGWWFADDSVATEEGIYIGATQAEVEKAYGTECFNGSNAFVINKAAGSLTIILEDGAVSSIQYAIKVD